MLLPWHRALVGLGLLMLATGCESNTVTIADGEMREIIQRTVSPGDRTLVLQGYNGRMTIESGPGPEAHLRFEKIARDPDPATARQLLKYIRIEEAGDPELYQYVSFSTRPTHTAVEVTARVPAQTRLWVQLDSGTVSIILPPDASMRMSVEVESGLVRYDLPGLSQEVVTPLAAGMHLSGILGSGDRQLDVRVQKGRVELLHAVES